MLLLLPMHGISSFWLQVINLVGEEEIAVLVKAFNEIDQKKMKREY